MSSTAHLNLNGLITIMNDYKCPRGYVIGNFREPDRLARRITGLPWSAL